MPKKRLSQEERLEEKHREIQRNLKLADILAKARLKDKETKPTAAKRKDASILLKYLKFSPQLNQSRLRDPERYKTKSYNLGKQILGLIDFMFIKYKVPFFLYRSILSKEGEDVVFGKNLTTTIPALEEQLPCWFIAVAQGGSFQKVSKSFLSKRESAYFLSAPYFSPIENIHWARLLNLGAKPRTAERLIERVISNIRITDQHLKYPERVVDLVGFFVKNQDQIVQNTFIELTDFCRVKIADPDFVFKGRTLNSMIRLSNDWHIASQKAKLGKSITWPRLFEYDWKYEDDHHMAECIELNCNSDIYKEGTKQRHCVYSYVDMCYQGRCHIFSLRVYKKRIAGYDETGKPMIIQGEEIGRVTLEVTRGTISQARRYSNAKPLPLEKEIMRRWAGDKGLTITAWY